MTEDASIATRESYCRSPQALQARKCKKSLNKDLFSGLQNPRKYLRKLENANLLDLSGYFKTLPDIFGDVSADPRKDPFRDCFAISGSGDCCEDSSSTTRLSALMLVELLTHVHGGILTDCRTGLDSTTDSHDIFV